MGLPNCKTMIQSKFISCNLAPMRHFPLQNYSYFLTPFFRGIPAAMTYHTATVPRSGTRRPRTPRTALRLYGVTRISPLRGECFSETHRHTLQVRFSLFCKCDFYVLNHFFGIVFARNNRKELYFRLTEWYKLKITLFQFLSVSVWHFLPQKFIFLR